MCSIFCSQIGGIFMLFTKVELVEKMKELLVDSLQEITTEVELVRIKRYVSFASSLDYTSLR